MISSISRKSRAFLGKPMLAVALALGGVAAMAITAPAYAQEAEAAPKIEISRDFQKAFAPVFNAYKASAARPDVQAKEAELKAAEGDAKAPIAAALSQLLASDLAQLRASKAAINNASDRYIWGQYAINYGTLVGNDDLVLEGIAVESESGMQTAKRRASLANFKARLLYDRGDYAGARAAFEEVAAISGMTPGLQQNIYAAYRQAGDNEGAFAYLSNKLESELQAGQPSELTLNQLVAVSKDLQRPELDNYVLTQVEYYPNAMNWSNAFITARRQQYDDEAYLDLMRLMYRTSTFADATDYEQLARLADPIKRPQEVVDILDAGIEAGLLMGSDRFVTDAKSRANAQIKTDETELGALDRDARAAGAKAVTPTVAGDAYLSYGEPAKAEELYKLALTKPGANAELLKTRIGIAQFDQGKYAEARQTFAEVSGTRAPIANLWRIYSVHQAN